MARGKSGSLAVYQLRHHINADEITHYTASLIIDSMRFYVQRRVKNKIKDFIDWRRDYVLNRYGKI